DEDRRVQNAALAITVRVGQSLIAISTEPWPLLDLGDRRLHGCAKLPHSFIRLREAVEVVPCFRELVDDDQRVVDHRADQRAVALAVFVAEEDLSPPPR